MWSCRPWEKWLWFESWSPTGKLPELRFKVVIKLQNKRGEFISRSATRPYMEKKKVSWIVKSVWIPQLMDWFLWWWNFFFFFFFFLLMSGWHSEEFVSWNVSEQCWLTDIHQCNFLVSRSGARGNCRHDVSVPPTYNHLISWGRKSDSRGRSGRRILVWWSVPALWAEDRPFRRADAERSQSDFGGARWAH